MRCRLVTSRWRNGSSNMTQMRALATIMVQLLCIRHHIGGRPLWLNCSSKRGADLDSRDNDSWTPFHLAALRGHLETVKLLIECGADRNIRDDENKTAYLWIWPPTMTDSIANFLYRSTMVLEEEVNTITSSISSQSQHPDVARPPQPRRGNEESDNDEEP